MLALARLLECVLVSQGGLGWTPHASERNLLLSACWETFLINFMQPLLQQLVWGVLERGKGKGRGAAVEKFFSLYCCRLSTGFFYLLHLREGLANCIFSARSYVSLSESKKYELQRSFFWSRQGNYGWMGETTYVAGSESVRDCQNWGWLTNEIKMVKC